MIKRRALAAHSFIGKRFQESHDRQFIERTKACPFKIGIHVRGGEITAMAVEVDHLAERGLTAVHKERTSQFDVAQAGRLNCSAYGNRRAGWNCSSADLSHGSKLSNRERC